MSVKDTADRATAYAGDKLASAGDKLHDAAGHLKDGASAAGASAAETLATARDKVATAYEAARDKSAVAYEGAKDQLANAADAARDKANAAYAVAREKASTARVKTADGIDESPLAALVGGVAIGVLLGALLPRSRREVEAFGPIGDRVGTIAKNALAAAREAGQDTLDELGVNKAGLREQADRLLDTAGKAASSAGAAAKDAINTAQS